MSKNLEHVAKTGQVATQESAVTDIDGKPLWFHSTLVPVNDSDGRLDYIMVVSIDTTGRNEAEKKSRDEQELLRRLLEIQENERRMVAYDIHDGFVQYAVGAHLRAQSIVDRIGDDADVRSAFEYVDQYLNKAIDEGRRMICHLRPMVLDEHGVVEAISHLIADDAETAGLSIQFEHDVQFERLEPTLEGVIFRIIQESISNVKRHSHCGAATIRLTQRNGDVELVVLDEGVGFDQKNVPHDSFGLRGICERARLHNGSAMIQSQPGNGTVIQVKLPIVEAE